MCFSAAASFTTAAILIPAGLFCLRETRHQNNSNWVFALFPVLFGLQQVFEGGVWWGLSAHDPETLRLSALGFLLFSHFFWLLWVPLSCYLTETAVPRKILFLLMTGAGAAFGISLYLPFLQQVHWLDVSVINHSIVYHTTLIYDDYLPRPVVTGLYMLIAVLPLLLSSNRYHQLLGAFVLLSALTTILLFNVAFISVWCYFAAVISLYIYYITIHLEPVPCKV